MQVDTPTTLELRSIFGFKAVHLERRSALFGLGLRSLLRLGLAPLGSRAAKFHQQLSSVSRLEHGLIIILPGIEGCSTVNDSIARGLVAARLSHAIKIVDWRRFKPWNPMHLAMARHNRAQAREIANLVVDYQRNFPDQPVHIIGHSAGAGMALFVLEELSVGHFVSSVLYWLLPYRDALMCANC